MKRTNITTKWKNKWNNGKWIFCWLEALSLIAIPLTLIAFSFIKSISKSMNVSGYNIFNHFWDWIEQNPEKAIIISIILFLLYTLCAFIYCMFVKKDNKKYIKQADSDEYGSAKWILNEFDEEYPDDPKKFEEIYPEFNENTEASFVVKSKKNAKGDKVIFNGIETKEAVHSLILGATGSGKSQKIIMPSIIANSRLKDTQEKLRKPCFVVTDPKGEIYENTSGELKNQGYEVLRLNLRDPLNSSTWNPLATAYNLFIKYLDFEKENIRSMKKSKFNTIFKEMECFKHGLKSCEICSQNYKKTKEKNFFYDIVEDKYFDSIKSKENYVISTRKGIKNLSNLEVSDLSLSLMTSASGDDTKNKSWFDGAEGILKGVIFAMLELIEEDRNALTLDQFNMVTVTKLISNQEGLIQWFKNFRKGRETNQSITAINKVIDSPQNSIGTYFSLAGTALKMFEDESLQDMLCKNEIDLYNFSIKEKPKVLFLIIPDDRTDKHPLASLFISQMYKASVFVANENKKIIGKEELIRPILFYLDEFGNMPAIPNFGGMMTVSRGRRMFFSLVLQDYEQLKSKYPSDAQTIKSNCLLTIYIKSTAPDTLDELSKMIGNTTVITNQITTDKEKGSLPTSMTGKKLIEGSDIQKLPDPYGIILFAKSNPSIVGFEYAWRMKDLLNLGASFDEENDPKPLNFVKDHWFNMIEYDPTNEEIDIFEIEDVSATMIPNSRSKRNNSSHQKMMNTKPKLKKGDVEQTTIRTEKSLDEQKEEIADSVEQLNAELEQLVSRDDIDRGSPELISLNEKLTKKKRKLGEIKKQLEQRNI